MCLDLWVSAYVCVLIYRLVLEKAVHSHPILCVCMQAGGHYCMVMYVYMYIPVLHTSHTVMCAVCVCVCVSVRLYTFRAVIHPSTGGARRV